VQSKWRLGAPSFIGEANMSDLLDDLIAAHGRLTQWKAFTTAGETARARDSFTTKQTVCRDSVGEREEAALLDGLRRGDERSYEQCVRQYGGMMLVVARRLLGNEDDARDAVQDAFLNAFRALSHFREEAKPSTWLHRIVMNAALMRLRAAKRRSEVNIDCLLPLFDEQGRHATPVRSLPVTTESLFLSQETRAHVHVCINRLPATYRTILLLRDIEDVDTADAAEILGITPNAVKLRLHRARQTLRTLLEREVVGTSRA
jgi:RNA polymerase sigma-70 factor (ECF subfamily)